MTVFTYVCIQLWLMVALVLFNVAFKLYFPPKRHIRYRKKTQ